MFEKNTVLILGAGASCDFGYPTGAGLIERIKETIKKEKVYKNHYKKSLSIISEHSRITDLFYNQHSVLFNEDEDLRLLLKALEKVPPCTIDSFLKNNSSHKIGKQMVAYQILKYEILNSNNGSLLPANNWHIFLADVISKCNPQDILNKLTIITFNYDHSLEYGLYHILKNSDYNDHDAQTFCEKFCKENIIHVYGKIRTDTIDIYTKYGKLPLIDDNHNDNIAKNTIRWILAEECAQRILVIREREQLPYTDHIKKARKSLQNADRIIILGFGFDNDNIDLLDLKNLKNLIETQKFVIQTTPSNQKITKKHVNFLIPRENHIIKYT